MFHAHVWIVMFGYLWNYSQNGWFLSNYKFCKNILIFYSGFNGSVRENLRGLGWILINSEFGIIFGKILRIRFKLNFLWFDWSNATNWIDMVSELLGIIHLKIFSLYTLSIEVKIVSTQPGFDEDSTQPL